MRTLWAIARNTLLMTLRRRAALGLVVFIALVPPLAGLYFKGDGTLVGILQVYMTYSFMIMGAVMMALLLYLSGTVLDTEIVNRQIFLLDVKPVPRWQVLLGKWLGLVLLCAGLVTIMVAQTYVVIMLLTLLRPEASRSLLLPLLLTWAAVLAGLVTGLIMARRLEATGRVVSLVVLLIWLAGVLFLSGRHIRNQRRHTGPGREAELAQAAYQQILVSRRSFRPELPDIEKEIAAYRKEMVRRGILDESKWNPDVLREHLRQIVSKKIFPISYNAKMRFHFRDLPDASSLSASLTLRHNLYGYRAGKSAGYMKTEWLLENPVTGAMYGPKTVQSKSGTTREFHMTSLAVSDKGTLNIIIVNKAGPEGSGEKAKPPARISVPLDNGLEILVPVGHFEANLIRAGLLLLIRLAMIAAIGIAANAFLSGQVAIFLVFGIILAPGLLNSFVYSSFAPPKIQIANQPQQQSSPVDVTVKTVMRSMLTALPNFDDTDPVPDLVVGREISARRLIWRIFADLGLRAGVIVLIGVVAYYRKEVGLPTIA